MSRVGGALRLDAGEVRLASRDGRRVHVEIQGTPVQDPDNALSLLRMVLIDAAEDSVRDKGCGMDEDCLHRVSPATEGAL